MWEYAKNYNKYREIKYLLNMSQGTRGKMSKGSRIRKNKYRGINTSIIAETIKEIKPKKKSKRENEQKETFY